LTAATLARLAALIVTVFLAGCDAPHSQESESAVRPPDPPVRTVELTASRDAVKLEGVATILNTDALLQLDADIRSAKVAADFSRAQLARFRLSTMLSRQTLDNAERQAGIDASQLKLLETRLKQTWGENAPFLKTDARQNLIAQISGGEQAIVRFDFPDLASGEPRNVRVIPLRGGSETPIERLWTAPSGNLAMPGVSFFGLIPAGPGFVRGVGPTAAPTGRVGGSESPAIPTEPGLRNRWDQRQPHGAFRDLLLLPTRRSRALAQAGSWRQGPRAFRVGGGVWK